MFYLILTAIVFLVLGFIWACLLKDSTQREICNKCLWFEKCWQEEQKRIASVGVAEQPEYVPPAICDPFDFSGHNVKGKSRGWGIAESGTGH